MPHVQAQCPNYLATLLVAAAFAPAAAQHSSGNITGDGKAGDVVRVERDETGFVHELKLDADGKYRMPRVPTGIYVVTVTHATAPSKGPGRCGCRSGRRRA